MNKALIIICSLLGSLTFSFCASAKEFPLEDNVSVNKIWSIKFNTETDAKTLEGNITITDSDGKLFETTLSVSNDFKTVVLSPVNQYIPDKTYTIAINKNIKSLKGISMSENVTKKFSIIGDEGLLATQYINNKNYKVLKCGGKVDNYILSNEMLITMPYVMYWSVQDVDAKNYIGKEIKVFKFTVNNHPLDNVVDNANKSTLVYIVTSENKVIGGYSFPNYDKSELGWAYTIDGKTLEEKTGLSYSEWFTNWMQKYK